MLVRNCQLLQSVGQFVDKIYSKAQITADSDNTKNYGCPDWQPF